MYYHQQNFYTFAWTQPENVDKYSNFVINLIFDWQTLLAAIIAGVPAALGARYLWKQIKLQKDELDRTKRKESISARLRLSTALASLTTYWKKCFSEIMDGNYSINTLPSEALATLMDAASTVDEDTFEVFRDIITEAQVFSSRYKSEVGPLEAGRQNTLLLNIASLHAATDSLYAFARFEAETVKKFAEEREIFEQSLSNMLAISGRLQSRPHDLRIIVNALNSKFRPDTSDTHPPVYPAPEE